LADLGLSPVDGEPDTALGTQQPTETFWVGGRHRAELIVAIEQGGDRTFGDRDRAAVQFGVNLGMLQLDRSRAASASKWKDRGAGLAGAVATWGTVPATFPRALLPAHRLHGAGGRFGGGRRTIRREQRHFLAKGTPGNYKDSLVPPGKRRRIVAGIL